MGDPKGMLPAELNQDGSIVTILSVQLEVERTSNAIECCGENQKNKVSCNCELLIFVDSLVIYETKLSKHRSRLKWVIVNI